MLQLLASGVHVGAHDHTAQWVALCRGGKAASWAQIQKPCHPGPNVCPDFSLFPIPCSLEESSKLLLPSCEPPSCFLLLGTWRRRAGENLQCSPVLHYLAPCPRPCESQCMLNCYGRKHFVEGRPLPLPPCTLGKSSKQ